MVDYMVNGVFVYVLCVGIVDVFCIVDYKGRIVVFVKIFGYYGVCFVVFCICIFDCYYFNRFVFFVFKVFLF